MDSRLGGGVVDLAVLTGLAVDRTDVDDAAEAVFAHGFDDAARHVEARRQVGLDDRIPLLEIHAVQGAVPGNAGVVDEDIDRPQVMGDLFNGFLAGIVIADIEFINGDVGFFLEFLGGLDIAVEIGGHLIPGFHQRNADVMAYAPGAPSDYCYSPHNCSPLGIILLLFICSAFTGYYFSRVRRTWRYPYRRRCTASLDPSWRHGVSSHGAG